MKCLLSIAILIGGIIGATACGGVGVQTGGETTPPVSTQLPTSTTAVQTATSVPPVPTPEQIPYKDLAYDIDGSTVKLVDGLAEAEAAPGSASKIITRFFGKEAFGDLNQDGKDDVAFLLTKSGAGSGTFYYLVVAYSTQDGYSGSSAALLGDRIAPQSTSIEAGMVVVNYTDRKPGESFAEQPSLDVTKNFTLIEGRLTDTVTPAQIKNRAWKWIRTQMNDGTVFTPSTEKAFTITFGDDGRVSGTTDCNNFSGSYTLQENLLSFGPFASTMMYCEGSQEEIFLKHLAEVQSFLLVDNQLVLELQYDSGQIIFE